MFVHKLKDRAPMFYCGNENCQTRSAHPVNKILADIKRRAELRKEKLAAKESEKIKTPAKKSARKKKVVSDQ